MKKMHGFHNVNNLAYFINKPIREVIVCLEEVFRSERLNGDITELNKKISELQSLLDQQIIA